MGSEQEWRWIDADVEDEDVLPPDDGGRRQEDATLAAVGGVAACW